MIMEYTPICIDDDILYISNLTTNGPDARLNYKLSSDDIKTAFKPIVKLGRKIKDSIDEISPDQVEIGMQLSVSVQNNNFIFSLVNTAAEAQFSVKYVWNKPSESESSI